MIPGNGSKSKVDKNVCRKLQGKAEAGNTCLQTPGTCESCPDWERIVPSKLKCVECLRFAIIANRESGEYKAEDAVVIYKGDSLCGRCLRRMLGY